jgi:hypothetical protein
MEFEKAIYRVYERCLEGLRDTETDHSSKYCKFFEFLTLLIGLGLLLILLILHVNFVGSSGCLPQLLTDYGLANNLPNFTFSDDQLLGINVNSRFAGLADLKNDDNNVILYKQK